MITSLLRYEEGFVSSSTSKKKHEQHAEKFQDARILVPVIGAMTRSEAIRFLPIMLNNLEPPDIVILTENIIRAATARELAITQKDPACISDGKSILTVPELISELHHMNTSQSNTVADANKAITALNSCFRLMEGGVFPSRAYVLSLQSMAEEDAAGAVPTLLLRTLLQLMRHSEELVDFISAEILPQIVIKQDIFGVRMEDGGGGASRLLEGVQYALKLSFEKQLDKKVGWSGAARGGVLESLAFYFWVKKDTSTAFCQGDGLCANGFCQGDGLISETARTI